MERKEIQSVVETARGVHLLVLVIHDGDGASATGDVLRQDTDTRGAVHAPVGELGTTDTLRVMWASPSGALWVGSADGFVATDVAVARVVEPRRNAVAPPELAADAPVLDVLHPVAVGVDPVARHELDAAVFDQLQAAPGQAVHLHEPLVGQVRLDHLAGAVAARHLQPVGLRLDQQAQFLEVGQHGLALHSGAQ